MLKDTISLEEIERSVRTTPMIAIDTILQALSATEHNDHFPHSPEVLNLFKKAVLMSQKADAINEKNDPGAALFQRELNQQTRHFIGVCFLRLFVSCGSCFQADSSRHKVFELFDDVFGADLYKYCGINKNEQTYIKERKLKDVVPTIEREISTTITSLSNIESLARSAFRKTFMEAMMNKKAQVIVLPFLAQDSQNSLTLRLNEIFSSIEHYLEVPENEMLQVYNRTQENLKGYFQEAEHYGTRYSQEYLGGVISKLLELLTQHFELRAYPNNPET
jgi:hypothetical protein